LVTALIGTVGSKVAVLARKDENAAGGIAGLTSLSGAITVLALGRSDEQKTGVVTQKPQSHQGQSRSIQHGVPLLKRCPGCRLLARSEPIVQLL
jgi:hypothetical protein